MNLTRTNFPKGWLPSNDAVNGDPDGLLRMDNLRIDKTGVIGLIDGQQRVATSASYFTAFYSRVVNGMENIWTTTGSPPNSVRRSAFSPMAGEHDLMVAGTGSPTNLAAFGSAFGYTLAVAGNFRAKDSVPLGTKPLGLLTPTRSDGTGPQCLVNSQLSLTYLCPNTINVGSGTSPVMSLDPTFFTGSMCSGGSSLLNSVEIGAGPAEDPATDIIAFPFSVLDKPMSVITKIWLDVILDGNPADPATYVNFYEHVFDNDVLPAGGQGSSATISCRRGDFNRFGNDQTLDWTAIRGVRFGVAATENATVQFGDIQIIGGSDGGVNGVYNYIQVDVDNDGNYLAKSPVSPLGTIVGLVIGSAEKITVINGSVTLFPVQRDTHTTQHFFYRRSVSDLGVDPNTGESLNKSSLNQFNFVGQSNYGQTFKDTLSDDEILQLNADGSLLPNMFLKTLNSNDTVNGLQEDIFGIEGIYNERMLYMTSSFVYLSERLNPDAVDTRYTLRPSGNPGEKNLWLKKLTNNTLILATNVDLYEISGTLLDLPDGSIDVNVRSIGEAYPPLSRDVCHLDNGLYYIAADGLRVTTGTNSANISPQLRPLFQNRILLGAIPTTAVHGVPTVAIYDDAEVSYSIAAARNRVYFSVPCSDQSRRLYVYDTITQTYTLFFTDPFKVYSTQGGEILASYGDGTAWFLDSVPGFGLDNSQGLNFKLRTVFDANGQPRNRKDTFTLKLVLDTGGRDVSVDLQKNGIGVSETDETQWINLGHVSANGQQTIYIPLDSAAVTLGFRYSLQLSDVDGVYTFKLYEYTIEYEPRPEQVNYLRVLPTNAGTISRKRWTTYAFVIDTLGNPITFTPYLDNVAWSANSIVNHVTKLTHIFYFTSEAIATDIGGVLSGGVFEFYGLNLEECVSEKLPAPTKFLVIPPNNYGTPNRKRHTSYKFQILTRGGAVTFTPIVDGNSHTQAVYSTAAKQTVDYFFPQSDGDVIGVDIGGTLAGDTPFEYYGTITPQTIEVLPDRLEYLRIPNSNFGLAARKRIRTISLVIDTRGNAVTFTPIVDGVSFGSSANFTTTGKLTVYYYFTEDVVGTDFGGTLALTSGNGYFEFYGLGTPENVEPLPPPCEYYIIPPNDYGTPQRKRHTSYKFQIITRSGRVRFNPILDGVAYPAMDYQTSSLYTDTTAAKQTVEYFFPAGDVIGIDIGGTLQSLDGVPFEFYQTVVPQKVDVLPERLQWLRLPNTNFGIPSRKRIRTLPIVIDTYGNDITFYPIVDNTIAGQPSIFNTRSKTTVYHYFDTDVFGTDFGGILSCDGTGKWLRDGSSLPLMP